eukprot:GHVL01008862.1.p2 GENE.GHVL01008862.1~~GHVL01008862.1.p2  ORF type:complete len:322 (+),score=28.64 GHVL01008862.1:144-1109(+)
MRLLLFAAVVPLFNEEMCPTTELLDLYYSKNFRLIRQTMSEASVLMKTLSVHSPRRAAIFRRCLDHSVLRFWRQHRDDSEADHILHIIGQEIDLPCNMSVTQRPLQIQKKVLEPFPPSFYDVEMFNVHPDSVLSRMWTFFNKFVFDKQLPIYSNINYSSERRTSSFLGFVDFDEKSLKVPKIVINSAIRHPLLAAHTLLMQSLLVWDLITYYPLPLYELKNLGRHFIHRLELQRVQDDVIEPGKWPIYLPVQQVRKLHPILCDLFGETRAFLFKTYCVDDQWRKSGDLYNDLVESFIFTPSEAAHVQLHMILRNLTQTIPF